MIVHDFVSLTCMQYFPRYTAATYSYNEATAMDKSLSVKLQEDWHFHTALLTDSQHFRLQTTFTEHLTYIH